MEFTYWLADETAPGRSEAALLSSPRHHPPQVRRRPIIVLVAITTPSMASATLTHAVQATPEQCAGDWSGTWPDGNATIELHVERIDAAGNGHGAYRWVSSTTAWCSWVDVHADAAEAKLERGRLRFKVGNQSSVFSVRGKEETTLRMGLWDRKGKKKPLRKLDRVAHETIGYLWRRSR